jgi:Domain of unknown function (DUF5069)
MTENLERMKVPGLRSAYEKVDGIVYFGRMIDKIRLHQAGKLPEDYLPYLGACASQAFDGRCCRFLQVDYSQLTEAVKGGVPKWRCWNGLIGTDAIRPKKMLRSGTISCRSAVGTTKLHRAFPSANKRLESFRKVS